MSTKSKPSVKRDTKARIKKKVKNFKARLPEGAIEIVSKKLGISRQTVSKHLNRFNTSHPIMGELANLAEVQKIKGDAIKSKIDNLINQ